MGRRKRKERGSVFKALPLSAIGAAAMYYFDPAMGKSRRAQTRDRIAGLFRSGARTTERKARFAGAKTYGLKERLTHLGSDTPPPTDEALKDKVESEVLRGDDFPKAKVNLEVFGGVVTVRGELDSRDQIDELESRIRKVTGVVDVENLVHLPGQGPPNKAPVRG